MVHRVIMIIALFLVIASAQFDTIVMTWTLQNSTELHWPTSYVVECFSEEYTNCTEISVNNESFSVRLNQTRLLPSTPNYNCCVSAVYDSYNHTTCTEIWASKNFELYIIVGVLGGIVVILLAIICGITILWTYYLLRRRSMIPERPFQSIRKNTTNVPIMRNMRYVSTTLTDATATGSQSNSHSQSETYAVAEYSEPINSLTVTTGPQSSTHRQGGICAVADNVYDEPITGHKCGSTYALPVKEVANN